MRELGWFLLGVGSQILADGLRLDEHRSVLYGGILSFVGVAAVYVGIRASRRRGSTQIVCSSCKRALPGLSAVLVQRCVHCQADNPVELDH